MTQPLSFLERFFLAFAWLFRAWGDGTFAARVKSLDSGAAAERPSLPPRPTPTPERAPSTPPVDLGAVRREAALALLSLLQREGRLVDFLEQDIASFSDADVGAAARVVHAGCRKALRSHVPVAAIESESEGSRVKLEPGYAISSYKLTGNVAGSAPYNGVLRHKGWRATRCELPETTPGHDVNVLFPAEVEL